MRHTQPLNADESRIDEALRRQNRSHDAQDCALQLWRMAHRERGQARAVKLERVADLLLGVRK